MKLSFNHIGFFIKYENNLVEDGIMGMFRKRFFVLKIKENKENRENTFGSQFFFFVLKTIENIENIKGMFGFCF